MRTAIFFAINKNYETQKTYWKTIFFWFFFRKSIGISGVNWYLCHFSLFSEPLAKKKLEKSENLQKILLGKLVFFSITLQLFAKLLSHSSNSLPPLKTHIEVFLN